MKETSKELIVVESLNPVELFAGDGLDPLLDRIETEVKSYYLDISSDKGRKEVASVAAKIARSKTTLDKMGKDLGEEYRLKVNALNAQRKKAWDRLEALQHDIRKPLTDWENTEKERVQNHQNGIDKIKALAALPEATASTDIQAAIESLSDYHKRDWQEFSNMAKVAIQATLESLMDKLCVSQKREAEQAELALLRKQEQERLQQEREKQIAEAAAAKATAEAEHAIKQAQEAAGNAARIERGRIEAEQRKQAEQQAARERDMTHRAKINNEALEYLKNLLPEDLAKSIITAIAQGRVPHININY